MTERCPHYDVRQPENAEGWVCQDCGQAFKADPWDRYYTAPETVAAMIAAAELQPGQTVLEPSAGNGAIVGQLPTAELNLGVVAIELIQPQALRALEPKVKVIEEDFLRWKPPYVFDVALMNPPYSSREGADGLHVAHALRCARKVVALVRGNFLHGFGRYHQVFRWARLLSITVLVRRPKFHGPANKGDGARHEYQILVLEKRAEERQPGEQDQPVVRFEL